MVPLISYFFLHIIDMTHLRLPFANRTEMEEAREGSTPAVPKAKCVILKNIDFHVLLNWVLHTIAKYYMGITILQQYYMQ